MTVQCKLLALSEAEVKVDGEKGTFAGYASVFNGTDSYGDTILPGAYKNTLNDRRKLPAMFFNHVGSAVAPKSDFPTRIGRWTKMEEDEKGLYVEGVITYGHPIGSAVIASMKNQTIDGLSIGYRLMPDDYEPKDDGGRLIKNISELVEVSVVETPADYNARISLDTVKSEIERIKSIREAEHLLRDVAGLSNEAARSLIAQIKSVVLSESGSKEAKVALSHAVQLLNSQKLPKGFL